MRERLWSHNSPVLEKRRKIHVSAFKMLEVVKIRYLLFIMSLLFYLGIRQEESSF